MRCMNEVGSVRFGMFRCALLFFMYTMIMKAFQISSGCSPSLITWIQASTTTKNSTIQHKTRSCEIRWLGLLKIAPDCCFIRIPTVYTYQVLIVFTSYGQKLDSQKAKSLEWSRILPWSCSSGPPTTDYQEGGSFIAFSTWSLSTSPASSQVVLDTWHIPVST